MAYPDQWATPTSVEVPSSVPIRPLMIGVPHHSISPPQDLNSHHSDSEDILSESHDSRPHPPATGALSSSSSRRSSVTDLTTKTAHGDQEGGGRERSGVVEWHPKTTADSDMATSDSPSHTGLDSPHHDHHYIQVGERENEK